MWGRPATHILYLPTELYFSWLERRGNLVQLQKVKPGDSYNEIDEGTAGKKRSNESKFLKSRYKIVILITEARNFSCRDSGLSCTATVKHNRWRWVILYTTVWTLHGKRRCRHSHDGHCSPKPSSSRRRDYAGIHSSSYAMHFPILSSPIETVVWQHLLCMIICQKSANLSVLICLFKSLGTSDMDRKKICSSIFYFYREFTVDFSLLHLVSIGSKLKKYLDFCCLEFPAPWSSWA